MTPLNDGLQPQSIGQIKHFPLSCYCTMFIIATEKETRIQPLGHLPSFQPCLFEANINYQERNNSDMFKGTLKFYLSSVGGISRANQVYRDEPAGGCSPTVWLKLCKAALCEL